MTRVTIQSHQKILKIKKVTALIRMQKIQKVRLLIRKATKATKATRRQKSPKIPKKTRATKLNTIPEVSLKNVDQITPNPLFHRRVMKKKMVQITKHGELSPDPSHRHQQAQHVQMKVVMNRRDSMNLQKTN